MPKPVARISSKKSFPTHCPSTHSLWIHTVLLFLQKVLSGTSLSQDVSFPFPVLPFHWYLCKDQLESVIKSRQRPREPMIYSPPHKND